MIHYSRADPSFKRDRESLPSHKATPRPVPHRSGERGKPTPPNSRGAGAIVHADTTATLMDHDVALGLTVLGQPLPTDGKILGNGGGEDAFKGGE